MPEKGSKTGVWYNCEWCGQKKYMNAYHYNKVKHHFCCQECSNNFREAISHEYRKCEICGKDMYVLKKSPKRFCGSKCQSEWQKTRVGFDNPRFEGDLISCDWCGKKYFENGYKLRTQKNFFCSKQCRVDWYSNVWSKQPEWRKESRKRAVKMLESGVISQTNSKQQLIVNDILDRIGVNFTNEFGIKYYSIDNYLTDYNLFIEVMGDFWHCNPIRYSNIKYHNQRESIRRDKAKATYVKKYFKIPILYLWETDINKNPDMCEKIIMEFINKNGLLKNYNSFNYSIVNNELVLNENIIQAYSELSAKEVESKMCLAS